MIIRTKIILFKKEQWNGYWVDAASTLRLEEDALICLDPVNNKTSKMDWKMELKLLSEEIALFLNAYGASRVI